MFRGQAFLLSILPRRQFFRVGKKFRMINPRIIYNGKYVTIGDNFWSWDGIRITAVDSYNEQKFSPRIKIGNNVNIMFDVHITCVNEIEIQDDVLIASRVYISDHQHGYYGLSKEIIPSQPYLSPVKRNLHSAGKVVIEKKCWLGEGVVILPNVVIGEGSIIGSNSVVSKSIPPMSIAVGIPAKVIKKWNIEQQEWLSCR
jgi:acetyltransferase-like isoleucine patch superfamily enzyme